MFSNVSVYLNSSNLSFKIDKSMKTSMNTKNHYLWTNNYCRLYIHKHDNLYVDSLIQI